MHIPDGFIDAKTALASGALAAAGLGIALRRVRRSVPQQRVPLIGLSSAFVFTAQLLNFPVAGGTSGHLLGALLAAVLLGPAAAVLVMATVVIMQCFLFADGGVTALGANIFNMAIVAPFVGYAVYAAVGNVTGRGIRSRLLATGFAAWCSTVAASVACAGELALSGTAAWSTVFPAMTGIHMLIALGEGAITTLVVAGVARTRPELLSGERMTTSSRYTDLVVYGALVSLGLLVFVAPFACRWPDGLEKVASTLGFEIAASDAPLVAAPLGSYMIPGLRSTGLSTIVAGFAGTVAAFLLAALLARALTPKTRSGKNAPRGGSSCRA